MIPTNVLYSAHPATVFIAGSFQPNGSSAIDATTVKGTGFTVAYTSTGLFTVTFDRVWPGYLSIQVTFAVSTATDVVPQLGAISLSSKTFQIRSLAAASLTDIANNAANWVHFLAVMRNTSLTK